MNGWVDESLRALVEVPVGSVESKAPVRITAWIDTAFNGHLVFPQKLIDELGLHQEAATEAILADGSTVVLESYVAAIDWFGDVVSAQVIANEGRLPLLGTELLSGRRLLVDYQAKTVTID